MKIFMEASDGSLVPVRMTIDRRYVSFLLMVEKDDASISHSLGVIEKLIDESRAAGVIIETRNLNLSDGDRPDQLRIHLRTA